jgi:hypothetical protein
MELVRKAIEMALAGDAPMLKFLLDRILPKERSVRVDLPPIDFANDAVDALGAIIAARMDNIEKKLEEIVFTLEEKLSNGDGSAFKTTNLEA